MRFGVLGTVTAWAGDAEVAVPERKVRLLLAALLTDPGRVVSADRLVEEVWDGDPPGKPANALQRKVSELRKALDAAEPGARDLVSFRDPGYLLRVTTAETDAGRFEALVARARPAAPAAKARLLEEALGLWRGPAFADVDLSFARPAASRLDEARLDAIESLAEARLELGAHARVLAELAAPLAEHPSRERLRAAHMRALDLAGRTTEALDDFGEHRERLADLGLDPSPALTELHRSLLRGERRPAASAPALPAPVTELIGRDAAIAEVLALLGESRLVTLTGTGGVGKTGLALAVARESGEPARLVELAALPEGADETALAEAALAALGVAEEPGLPAPERLAEAVRGGVLLVLDNCEHVVAGAAALAARLLRAAPGLRVLATGREPLSTAGEALYPVPPLDAAAAARLFAARVAATLPGFALTHANTATVEAICRRLDGVPLALELAAPRVRVLGPEKLLERLDDRFGLLTGGYRDAPARQRTLRAVIDWSYGLLSPREREVLRGLSVFADGCTLESAEAVLGDVLGELTGLVDRSLVSVAPGPRFRLLESVSAYAAARLDEEGETPGVRARHTAHFAGLAASALVWGTGQREWLPRLDAEAADVRAALEHGAPVPDALAWYWVLRGRYAEADRHLSAPDARTAAWRWGVRRLRGDLTTPPPPLDGLDGRTLWFLGFACQESVDFPAAWRFLARALPVLRAEGDAWGVAAALALRAVHTRAVKGLDTARGEAEESMAVFTRLGDQWGRVRAAYPLASIAEATGDYDRAAALHTGALADARGLGLWREAADRLCGLGRIALLRGDLTASLRLHTEALALSETHHHRNGIVSAEIGLGLTHRRAGDLDAAETTMRRVLGWGRERDFPPITSLALAELGFTAELRGDRTEAHRLHTLGLAEAHRADDRAVALALEGLAGATPDPAEASRLLTEAARLREDAGTPLPPGERGDVERITARLGGVGGTASGDAGG
ncbi:hypothetical protein Afil01_63610 [Actinorhabdospora filicis]|uniref:OmpR/PhoB-type domain-containing protein n=1 Tax=Actinorhabdospora filicis TaxID=1785913 RepID=A0A9W6SRF4_9ACTN|nr:BTAD domain-containing putative transcriptional regulator [Actinorhabdospora filicis]GLZ81554.1 hypothetical protein Afil01_63610 [Actinorhabdospora filicis]